MARRNDGSKTRHDLEKIETIDKEAKFIAMHRRQTGRQVRIRDGYYVVVPECVKAGSEEERRHVENAIKQSLSNERCKSDKVITAKKKDA